MGSLENFLYYGLLILIIILVIWFIAYYAFSFKGESQGAPCDEKFLICEKDLFCSGAYTCEPKKGGGKGAKCDKSADCQFGFYCNTNNSKDKICEQRSFFVD